MTTAQVSLRLGKSVRTVHRMVDAGRIRATRVPGYKGPLLFEHAEVERVRAELAAERTGQSSGASAGRDAEQDEERLAS
jgi:excisionase family DNA binding protein